ncbi:hypothetical protein D3C75_359780 [compost metagenome]
MHLAFGQILRHFQPFLLLFGLIKPRTRPPLIITDGLELFLLLIMLLFAAQIAEVIRLKAQLPRFRLQPDQLVCLSAPVVFG